MPAGGRPRCTSRARRRRSSTSSRGRASRTRPRVTRSERSRSAPATASSTARSSTPTRSVPATTELVVLAFGQRHYAANTLLPRAGVSWLGPTWVLQGAPEDHPWAREAAVGAPTWTELAERPACVANLDDVPTEEHQGATVGYVSRDLGQAVGSERTGLQHYVVPPGMLMNPPHSHSAEEEIFVVLEGSGTLQLYPSPRADDQELEEFPIRAGCSIARPAGTPPRPRDQGRCRRPDAARIRHARSERHLLLPTLGEDQHSWRRRDRPARAGRLLGRRGLKESGGPR